MTDPQEAERLLFEYVGRLAFDNWRMQRLMSEREEEETDAPPRTEAR